MIATSKTEEACKGTRVYILVTIRGEKIRVETPEVKWEMPYGICGDTQLIINDKADEETVN